MNKRWNMIFHKIHIPAGIILIIAGVIHGFLAGNVWNTGIKEASLGSVLFTANAGTLCLIVAILLGLSYVLRKILKGKWTGGFY